MAFLIKFVQSKQKIFSLFTAEHNMEIIFIVAAIFIGLFFLKSVAGMLKFAIKIAIYALIGLAVYRGLVHFGILR